MKEEGRAQRERNEGGEAGMGEQEVREHEVREGVKRKGGQGGRGMKERRQVSENMK